MQAITPIKRTNGRETGDRPVGETTKKTEERMCLDSCYRKFH